MSIHWRSHSPPPPLHAKDNSTFNFYFLLQVFFKDTLYFYLSTFCFQYFLHLFKSFSLLITSTTRVQIPSNLSTTGYSGHTAFTVVKQRCRFRLRRKTIPLYLTSFKTVCFRFWISIITSKIIFSIKIFNFYKFFSKTWSGLLIKNFVHQNAFHPMWCKLR